MNNEFTAFITGIITGAVILFVIASFPGNKIDRCDTAIDECGKELPRNQKCAIYARPEEFKK